MVAIAHDVTDKGKERVGGVDIVPSVKQSGEVEWWADRENSVSNNYGKSRGEQYHPNEKTAKRIVDDNSCNS